MTQEALFAADLAGGADTPTPAASWLDAVLEAGSSWRRSAHAKLAPCERCGVLVLSAADTALDWMTESTVDLALLDRGLEVEALLAGRYTVEAEVSRHGGGPLLFRRDRWLTPREPATRRRLWVPEHVCHKPLGWPLPPAVFYPFESRLLEVSDECPF